MGDALGSVILVAMIIFGIFFVGFLLFITPLVITNWKLYSKAGQPGWAGIVPVYSSVVMARIGKKAEWMGWVAGISGLMYSVFPRINYTSAPGPAELAAWLAVSILGIVVATLTIILFVGFVPQYRHARGESTALFWVCYFLLPIAAVFMVKNIAYKDALPVDPQSLQQPGQQPLPPPVPPIV